MDIKRSILKYITGSEAADEKLALDEWKAQSEENLAALKNIVEMQQHLSILGDYKEVDEAKAWTKIEQNLHPQSETKVKSNLLMKIAAALIFVIAATVVFKYTYNDTTTRSPIVFDSSVTKNVKLNDGSHIILDGVTTLTQTSERNVIINGSAYFDIAKDPKNPFVITTNHGLVTVLGTAFNIFTNKTKSQVYVTEGKVKISYREQDYFLEASQMITLNDQEVAVVSSPVIKPNAWKNKILAFENKSLKYVLESVAIYYNVTLDWQIKEHQDQCKINTVFKDETIQDVMKELALLSDVRYELTTTKLIIKSYKC